MTLATWDGLYFSGDAPDGAAVRIAIERESLGIERAGAPALQWSYRSMRLTEGLRPGEAVRLQHPESGDALVIADPAFLDSVRRLAPGAALSRRPPIGSAAGPGAATASVRHQTGQPRVLLWVAGTIGAVLVAYFWLLPTVGALLAHRVPVAWEVDLGDAVADELAPADAVCDDPTLVGTIDGIVARLASGLTERPYEFRVSVVDDTLVNAFAAPGGRIVVMRGLLSASETPEELAGVLAHEMQHVQLRHGTRAILRQLPVQAVSAVLGGGGGADGAAALVGTLGVLRYARGDEAEADREGMRLLIATGIDPRGMLDFFETLDEQTGAHAPALTYLSTHPATDERRARLAEMAAESSAPSMALATDAAWSEIVTLCRAPTGAVVPAATAPR